MANPSKRKGDRAELEVQALWQEHTGYGRRALGAGRKDDVGDIHGIPNTVVQVVNWKDVSAAVRNKPVEAEMQRLRTGVYTHAPEPGPDGIHPVMWIVAPVDHAATFVRLRGGEFRVVMTPDQFFAMWRETL